jgi:hypothetical protein
VSGINDAHTALAKHTGYLIAPYSFHVDPN